MKKTLFMLLFSCSFTWATGQDPLAWEENKALQKLRLPLSSGGRMKLQQIDQNAATVLVFMSPECPLSQVYIPILRELYVEFNDNQIGFMVVIPGNSADASALEKYRQANQIPFPIVIDKDYKLCKLLHPKVTPEVFLLDPWGGIKYRGAIDNRVVALGQLRNAATDNYLAEALEKWLMHEPFWPNDTQSIGCLIEIP